MPCLRYDAPQISASELTVCFQTVVQPFLRHKSASIFKVIDSSSVSRRQCSSSSKASFLFVHFPAQVGAISGIGCVHRGPPRSASQGLEYNATVVARAYHILEATDLGTGISYTKGRSPPLVAHIQNL